MKSYYYLLLAGCLTISAKPPFIDNIKNKVTGLFSPSEEKAKKSVREKRAALRNLKKNNASSEEIMKANKSYRKAVKQLRDISSKKARKSASQNTKQSLIANKTQIENTNNSLERNETHQETQAKAKAKPLTKEPRNKINPNKQMNKTAKTKTTASSARASKISKK